MTFPVNPQRLSSGNENMVRSKIINDNAADKKWMHHALALADHARVQNEVPIGAVIISHDTIIGEGWNHPIALHDSTAHAEIIALRQAGKTCDNYRIPHATLYVTLEPCAMCVGAIIHARIHRLVFGAFDPKTGAVTSVISLLESPHFNHAVNWQAGVLSNECSALLSNFFSQRR